MMGDAPVRIAVVGPECAGKTTLAAALGEALGAAVVPEVARAWLPALGRPYVEADLVALARAQRAAEDAVTAPIVVCDTTTLVIRVWSEVRYGRLDPRIARLDRPSRYALHLLCEPDLPWEADPLRENPHDRDALLLRYVAALDAAGVRAVRVCGHGDTRLRTALDAARRVLPPP